MKKRGGGAGIDMPFSGGAAGLCGDHIDLDLAVVRRESMLDARNDRHRGTALAEMLDPCRIEGRLILTVAQIDLRMHDVVERRAGERQRRRDAFGNDELGFKLDRL